MKRIKPLLLLTVMLILSLSIPLNSYAAKISKSSVTLIKGQTTKLKIAGSKGKVKWSSGNKAIAKVSSSGKITARKKGVATIIATVNKKTYSCKITVQDPTISRKSVSVNAGEKISLSLAGTDQKTTWKSSNSKVASVNNRGEVIAKKKGKATIIATVLNKKFTCKITVKARKKFSEADAIQKLTYKQVNLSWGILYWVKNNYSYSLSLDMEALFYNEHGKVIDTAVNEAYCIEPGAEFPLFISKPLDRNLDYIKYSNIRVRWKAYDASDNAPRSYLKCSPYLGNKKVIAPVKNTYKKKIYYRAVLILYKNGMPINYCQYGVYEIRPNETQYLDCEFPYDDHGIIEVPDSYKIFFL